MMPSYLRGWPCSDRFEWKFVNYAPIVTVGALILITIWWEASAKKWFKGPVRTIDAGRGSLAACALGLPAMSPRRSRSVRVGPRTISRTSCCASAAAPRLRGLRGAARDGDQAGRVPVRVGIASERELAERMGVSRATLREAIAALCAARAWCAPPGAGVVERSSPSGHRLHRRRGSPGLAERRDAGLLDSLVFRRVVEPGAC